MVFCHGCLEDIDKPEIEAVDCHGDLTYHKVCIPHGFNQGVPEWEES